MEDFMEVTEILKVIEISPELLEHLQEEEIICLQCFEDRPGKYISREGVEEIRIAKVLMEDLGVNIEGVDIILRLRRQIIQMQTQFQSILKDLREFIRSVETENY